MDDYTAQLSSAIDAVYRDNPEIPDHRAQHPWLTGWLGSPDAAVWFVAENPSATQVDRIHSNAATVESQWAASRGDRLLREALVDAGLKRGSLFEPGGWNCYLTDVMKSEVTVKDWSAKPAETKQRLAELWAPVLALELALGSPKLLVVLGGNAHTALRRLTASRLVPELAPMVKVHHYSYVMMRPDRATGMGPGDPQRQRAWIRQIGELAASVEESPT